jgi:hypothetical protein
MSLSCRSALSPLRNSLRAGCYTLADLSKIKACHLLMSLNISFKDLKSHLELIIKCDLTLIMRSSAQ